MSKARLFARLLARSAALALFSCIACSPGPDPVDGSETHFLTSCVESCQSGATCVCGVCTTPCGDASDCGQHGAESSCVSLAPRVAEQRCAPTTTAAICDAPCVQAQDCAWLGTNFACQAGFCRSETSPVPENTGGDACQPSDVSAEDVVVLGDSLIELSKFTADLEQRALSAGLIQPDTHYRRYASALMSFLAEGSFSIGAQYSTARAERPARVIIMDGGATDMLNEPCGSAPTPSCAAVDAALSGAEQLFSQFASDGVEHVVYFFYPDVIGNPTVKAGLDSLRPLLENACGKSAVACHWLDLRLAFADHPEYLGPDGIVFSDAGAEAAASAVFELMDARCIAR